MRTKLLTFVITLAVAAGAFAQGAKTSPEARAQDLLKKARAALGSEAKLKTVQGLSVSGKFRRAVGGRDISGDLAFDIKMPDKYRKDETMTPAPSVSITSIDIINGENIVLDAHTAGPGNIVYNRPGTGSSATAEVKAAANRAAREEYARMFVSWLLSSPSSFPVQFKFAGEAEAPDGRADVLQLEGPNGFMANLFLDQKTHLPLMLSYNGQAPRLAMQTSKGDQSQEELQRKIREQMAKSPSGLVEFQLHFSEYQPTDGILFPHSITKSIAGQVTEEWQMSKYTLNPSLNPERFEKK